MTTNTYNGWTNYATWRVNLEMFDGWSLGDVWGYDDADPKEVDLNELGEILKDHAIDEIEYKAPRNSFAHDYALAFIDDVNWYEIAEHLAEV